MIGRDKDLSRRQSRLTFTVKGAEAHRLDHYLGTSLSWRSRTRVQELIHEGRIRVNGVVAKPSRKVRGGDEITVELPEGSALPPDYDAISIEVLYEDRWIVAVNKPPGLLVHPTGAHLYDTLINYLHHRYREERTEDGEPVRPRLCHRIDKETTGVVVVGKDPQVHSEIRNQFETRAVSKEYQTLVQGDYPQDGEIDLPIGEGHDLTSSLGHEVLRSSRTIVSVLGRYDGYTLLRCVPATGRQNQIRIHLAAVGFPIVGDERFGAGPAPEGFPDRYLLHSRAIRFYHPRLKSWVELSAPLPADLTGLLEELPRQS